MNNTELELSKDLKLWRAERPDEWIMDRFIRKAIEMEEFIEQQKDNKVASFYDNKGKLYVDCTECERGKNGNDEDKCSAGWRIKKPKSGGCFIGTIMLDIDLSKAERLK